MSAIKPEAAGDNTAVAGYGKQTQCVRDKPEAAGECPAAAEQGMQTQCAAGDKPEAAGECPAAAEQGMQTQCAAGDTPEAAGEYPASAEHGKQTQCVMGDKPEAAGECPAAAEHRMKTQCALGDKPEAAGECPASAEQGMQTQCVRGNTPETAGECAAPIHGVSQYRFTTGDKPEALSVMREAAQWLIDSGKPMWALDELTPERLPNPEDEFIVMWEGGQSAAALILSFEDKFFWPDIPAGTSGFIHKLAVRREFAGRGVAEILIGHALRLCQDKGIHALRLDCDARRARLCALYERCGFRIKDIRTFQTQRFGTLDVALYELLIKKK